MKKPSAHVFYELQLLPQTVGGKSVLALLNQTRTYGGKEALKELLTSPCASLEQIRQRQEVVQFVTKHLGQLTIDIAHAYVVAAENHLSSNLAWSSGGSWLKRYQEALGFAWFRPHDFTRLRGGTTALRLVLRGIEQKTAWLATADNLPPEIQRLSETLHTFFSQPAVQKALKDSSKPLAILRADYCLRYAFRDVVKTVFRLFYQLDAYCALARFTQTTTWTYPRFVDSPDPVFQATGLTHPLLDPAVPSAFTVAAPGVVALLTGGNMSGKTTFLKACGIAVYMAHLGLPVPAQSIQLSFFDELFTSIHLSDNLERGYSHFYQELMRIKAVADAVGNGQRVLMLADELFRGTHPADALLCSRQVIDKLSVQTGSLFLISSHLPHISDTYLENKRVRFHCFRTEVIDGRLVHRYTIEPGIAQERTGLRLLEQTGVLAKL